MLQNAHRGNNARFPHGYQFWPRSTLKHASAGLQVGLRATKIRVQLKAIDSKAQRHSNQRRRAMLPIHLICAFFRVSEFDGYRNQREREM